MREPNSMSRTSLAAFHGSGAKWLLALLAHSTGGFPGSYMTDMDEAHAPAPGA